MDIDWSHDGAVTRAFTLAYHLSFLAMFLYTEHILEEETEDVTEDDTEDEIEHCNNRIRALVVLLSLGYLIGIFSMYMRGLGAEEWLEIRLVHLGLFITILDIISSFIVDIELDPLEDPQDPKLKWLCSWIFVAEQEGPGDPASDTLDEDTAA